MMCLQPEHFRDATTLICRAVFAVDVRAVTASFQDPTTPQLVVWIVCGILVGLSTY